MIRLLRWGKRTFSKYPMRTKMIFSFSATIVLIFVFVMIIINLFLGNSSREKALNSVSHSFDQAYSFLENKLQSMQYASDLVYYNGDLQSVLSADSFTADRNVADQYREFLVLDNVFATVEMNENIYFARIFIPDDIYYANNFRHFYGQSQLEAREDYEIFLANSENNLVYFTKPEMVTIPGNNYPVSVISLLRTVKSSSGSSKTIAVEQIGIETTQIQSVIDNANITSTGIVYLLDSAGTVICASTKGLELLESLTSQQAFPSYKIYDNFETETIMSSTYLVNHRYLTQADWTLVAMIPQGEIDAQSTYNLAVMLLLTIFAVIAIILVSYALAKYYTRRLNLLAEMMTQVKNGNIDIPFGEHGADEIGRLFQDFEYMTKEIQNLLKQQYRSGKAIKSAQLKALQAQINPHFLYNTLDLINWEAIDHDVPEIADITQNLAKFYRISLNKGQQIVSIEEEISHVVAYVQIENRFFDDSISLTIDVPDEIMRLACINIILQPFVENCIVHGITKNITVQELDIVITARLSGNNVILTIVDDGLGMDEEQLAALFSSRPSKSHGYGIKNIQSRIQLCYGEAYGLTFSSEKGKGTKVTICIPALTIDEAQRRISD